MNYWQELKETSRLEENYRTLARKGMGTETKNSARVGLELDFYEPKNGDKRFGKITKMSSKGYQVKDDKGKTYSFLFHDRKKAQSLLKGKSVSLRNQVEETQLDEVTDKEINAMKKVSKDMQKVLKDYQKIATMGDKELKDTKHNPTYKKVLDARDSVLTMIGTLQTKKLMQKEAVSPAQQAAIAISKKEKGEKPKNESVMDSYREMWEQGQKYAPKQELPEQDLHEIAVPRKEFEKIKKGNTVSVVFDSSMKKGHKMDLLVKSITRSNKYDVDKINMVAKDDPRNRTKFTFYSRKGGDATLAWGDMATVLKSYKVSK